jgi:2-dehydropantoate 2-reductase
MSDGTLRIAVVGAGAVGGYFGAQLAKAGHDVTFIARGDHLRALQTAGLRIESKLADIRLPQIRATDRLPEIGSSDFILICVKLWDTDAVLAAIAPHLAERSTVISLQNGVEKEELLAAALGGEHVVGGVCYIAAQIVSPGLIRHTGTMQRVIVGELDGETSARTEQFVAACRHSGIDAEVSRNIRRAIWEKFVFLVGTSGATVTMRSTIGGIRSNPRTRAFLLDLMREASAVAAAHGIDLPAQFAEDRLKFCDQLPPQMVASMRNDLEAGKRLEIDWFSGAVCKLGTAAGIETPLNRAVRDILELRAAGSSPIS